MKMHKTIKRPSKGPLIMLISLNTNTNRMKNEERPKNDVEIDYSRDSSVI